MINKAGIEARVLAPGRAEAERLLVNLRSGTGWTLDGFNVIRYPYVIFAIYDVR